VYSEKYENRSEASKREIAIKKMKKTGKKELFKK
jgi:predicted GIY-YIG superfamily endonuclease